MDQLRGATAVVTGGGSGIGRGVCLEMARAGSNLVVSDLDLESAEKVVEEAREHGVDAIAVRTDVSVEADVQLLADTSYDQFGTVNVLFNNAGVTLRPFRPFWEASVDDIRWTMGVNFWGVIHGFQAFVPRMGSQTGFRSIAATSSTSSISGYIGHSPYTASKGAVDGFIRTARAELAGLGIKVTVVYPGTVRTDIWRSERHRPESERSERRSFEDIEGHAPGYPDPATDPPRQPRTPEQVAPLIVRGIVEGRPYVMTHPVNEELLRNLYGELLASYRPLDDRSTGHEEP